MAKRKRRTFTPEFKAKVVLEALKGESAQAEVCRRHNLSEDQVSKWKQQFLENAVTLFESGDKAAERMRTLSSVLRSWAWHYDIHKKVKAWLNENADLDAHGGNGSPE